MMEIRQNTEAIKSDRLQRASHDVVENAHLTLDDRFPITTIDQFEQLERDLSADKELQEKLVMSN